MADGKKKPTRNPKTGKLTLPAVGSKPKKQPSKTSARSLGQRANEQFKAGAAHKIRVTRDMYGIKAGSTVSEKEYVRRHHAEHKGVVTQADEKKYGRNKSYQNNRKYYARQTGT